MPYDSHLLHPRYTFAEGVDWEFLGCYNTPMLTMWVAGCTRALFLSCGVHCVQLIAVWVGAKVAFSKVSLAIL